MTTCRNKCHTWSKSSTACKRRQLSLSQMIQQQQSTWNFSWSSSNIRKDQRHHLRRIFKCQDCRSLVFHLKSSDLSAPVDHFLWNIFSQTISSLGQRGSSNSKAQVYLWANTIGREIVLKCQSHNVADIVDMSMKKSAQRLTWFFFSALWHFTTFCI